ncbi:MAG: hypothetical protein LBD23_12190, partial [Oscillospiraceae bacterium]|nr:hypothetical protein [Oscillospiraceae bacterium]
CFFAVTIVPIINRTLSVFYIITHSSIISYPKPYFKLINYITNNQLRQLKARIIKLQNWLDEDSKIPVQPIG